MRGCLSIFDAAEALAGPYPRPNTHTARPRASGVRPQLFGVRGVRCLFAPPLALFNTPSKGERRGHVCARLASCARHCAALRSIAQHCARPRTCQPLRHHCCVLTLPCLSPSGPVAILYALVRTGSRLVRGGPQRSAAVRAVPHMTATQCPVLTHAVPGLSLGVSAAVPMRTGVHTAS